MNAVCLVGRLVRDPDLRYLTNGTPVATFSLAVDNPFKKGEADFLDIVTWQKTAENVANHLQKGRLVAINGRIQTRTYETTEGQKRKVVEVVASEVQFLDRVKEG